MARRAPPDKAPVDLGISALLDDRPPSAPDREPAPVELTQADTESTSSSPPLTALEQLVQSGEWSKVGVLCEAELPPQLRYDEDYRTLELRVWWIKSQMEQGTVPLSILAAPLEEVADKLRGVERSGGMSAELQPRWKRLAPLLMGMLETIERALMPDDERTANRLREIRSDSFLNTRGVSRAPHATTPSMTGSQIPQFNMRGIPVPTPPTSTEAVRFPTPMDSISSGNVERTPKRSLVIAAAIIGAMLIVVALWMSDTPVQWAARALKKFGWQTSEEKVRLSDGVSGPALIPSTLEPATRVDQLGAILEDFRNDRPNLPALTPLPTAARVSAPHLSDSTSSAAPDLRVGTAKEKLRMDGPLEPKDFPRGESVARQPDTQADKAHSPAVSVQPGFEEYRKPRLYTTLVTTTVMSAPSIRARELNQLPQGVEVLVEAKEGYWLRIRSQKGNTGFILAQDATPAK